MLSPATVMLEDEGRAVSSDIPLTILLVGGR